MHTFDIIIAVIGLILVFIGIKRGLIGELIRLAAMIAGIFVAFLYYHDVAHGTFINKIPVQTEVKNAIAFLLIYLLCAVLIIAIGWVIKKVVHCTPLGMIDRVIGGAIGLLKTLLVAYVACLSISSLPIRRIQNDFNHSIVYRTYRILPKFLTLKSILKKRNQIRTMFNRKPPKKQESIQNKLEKFKAAVDSAKEAQTASSSKDQ